MARVRRKRHRERRLAEVLEAEYEVRRKRQEVINRHARPAHSWGGAMKCVPTRAEVAGEAPRKNPVGNDGKVIFDSRDAAEACAREMLPLGGSPMVSYHCPRHRPGHDGHWHLTTDGHRARREAGRVDAQFRELRDQVARYAS